jgi:hypothetical protein
LWIYTLRVTSQASYSPSTLHQHRKNTFEDDCSYRNWPDITYDLLRFPLKDLRSCQKQQSKPKQQ